jgi:hypothetical protein
LGLFLFLTCLVEQVDDRVLILGGLLFMLGSNIVIIPFWGSKGLGLWQLILSSLFIAVGYPVASAITYALFRFCPSFFFSPS